MPEVLDTFIRDQLLVRREKLQHTAKVSPHPQHLHHLLQEVDSALERIEDGSYGICERCHESIESDRLIADPLIRVCLCNLSPAERDALEQDLQLAARVQRGLLPPSELVRPGWHVAYHYQAAGLVSGDYCDVIDAGPDGLFFMIGDVSGKGVAASMLTAHLHAMFRTLISVGLPLKCMLEHASRVFAESTLPNHYATLVCGHAFPDGRLELSNAGHPPPLVARGDEVSAVDGAGLPVGMFANEEFAVTELHLEPGNRLIVYSDGVSEAEDGAGSQYGTERLRKLIGCPSASTPPGLVALCREDLLEFCGEAPMLDDRTLFVLARSSSAASI